MPEEKEKREKEEEEKKVEKKVEKAKESKTEERSSFEILFHKKPAMLLTLLLQDRVWYPSALARESGQSYVYATELVKHFEREGLVACTQKGKRRIVKLTEKGDKIARIINEVSSALATQPLQKEAK